MTYNIVLASASPRRKELLGRFFPEFTIMSADIDETLDEKCSHEKAAELIAAKKAEAVSYKCGDNDLIIAADTIVSLNEHIFGKPKDDRDAYNTLKALSGKTHRVITGVCCMNKSKNIDIGFSDVTEVEFEILTEDIINKYLKTKEHCDKAGSYAVQGKGSLFIKSVKGDYDNVMGLPAAKLMRKLMEKGIDIL